MKILVIDIETTGFSTITDAIVEIGMVLVDTDTKKTRIVFNKVVKDKNFDSVKHKGSWIFENSTLSIKDVEEAKTLVSYTPKIQKLLDKYPVTAFNKAFDMRFLKDRGFAFQDIKCLMHSSTPHCNLKNKIGGAKKPSVQEAYNIFFPKDKYVEKHRGADDAKHEAKILLRLCEIKTEQNKKYGEQKTMNFKV